MEDGLDSIKADTSQTLMRNARHQRLSAHYIQQALMSQVGFVGYIEFVVLNFVTAPSRCQKRAKRRIAQLRCAIKTRKERGSRPEKTAPVSGAVLSL
ncbi:hypothetical protein HG619_18595 [Pseudomonas syringae]|nr:hypothetical protein [Pseudomonas syringae]